MCFLPPPGAVPPGNRIRSPLRLFLVVAPVACVRRAELDRQIGAWNAETVIGPWIDHHVVFRRDVAVYALRPGASCRMVMVSRCVVVGLFQRRKALIASALMALHAERIALGLEVQTMRIVAIGAAHPLRVHLALEK